MGKIIDRAEVFIADLVGAIDGKIPDVRGAASRYGIPEEVAGSIFSSASYAADGYPVAVPERMAMLVELDRFHRGSRGTALAGWKEVVLAHNQELEAS